MPEGTTAGASLVFNLIAQAEQFKTTMQDAMEYVKKVVTEAQKYSEKETQAMTKRLAKNVKKALSTVGKSLDSKSIFGHFGEGLGMISRGFMTVTGYISKLKFLIMNIGNLVFNVLISPFTILSTIINKVREGLLGIFKLFEWIQYQIFMQFMNIWLLAKTVLPVLETFVEYNREIYNTWALIGTMWDESFSSLKTGLMNLSGSDVDNIADSLGVVKEQLQSIIDTMSSGSYDLGQYLSDLGKNISQVYGQLPKDVASAFYQLASATVPFEDLQQSTELAAQAAVAGVTTISNAVEGGIQAVYAFGLEMSDLTEVYNDQFTAIRYGILRYEDLVKVMGRVYQPAASLSSSLANMREMYATIAFVTRVGLSPEMGAFGLARLYEALAKPTVVKGLKAIGVAVYDLQGRFKGLKSLAQGLTGVLKGFSVETQQKMLTNLGFDMRAVRVLRSMINNFTVYEDVLDRYRKDTEAATESTSAFQEAFGRMQESVAFKMDKLKASWETLKINFVEKTLSAITFFMDKISDLFDSLVFTLQYGSVSIGKFTISIANIIKTIGSFYAVFAVIASISGALSGLMHPLGLLIASFALLTSQAQKSTEFFKTFSENFPALGSIFRIVADYVSVFVAILQESANPIKAFVVVFQQMFKDIGVAIGDNKYVKAIKQSATSFWNGIKAIFDPKKAKEVLNSFYKKTGIYFSNLGDYLGYTLGSVMRSVGSMFANFLGGLLGIDINEGQLADKGIAVFADIIRRLYKGIMAVFAGIFGRVDVESYGLRDLAIDIAKTFGLLIEDEMHFLHLNPKIIFAIGNSIRALLWGAIKFAFANLDTLILPIIGLSLVKSLLKGLSGALLAVEGGAFLGGTLKLTAVLYLAQVIMGANFQQNIALRIAYLIGTLLTSVLGMKLIQKISLSGVLSTLIAALSNPITMLVAILVGVTAGIWALYNYMKSSKEPPVLKPYKGTRADIIGNANLSNPIDITSYFFSKATNISNVLTAQIQDFMDSYTSSLDSLYESALFNEAKLSEGASKDISHVNDLQKQLDKIKEEKSGGFFGWLKSWIVSEEELNIMDEQDKTKLRVSLEKVTYDFFLIYTSNLRETLKTVLGDSASFFDIAGLLPTNFEDKTLEELKAMYNLNYRVVSDEAINYNQDFMSTLSALLNISDKAVMPLLQSYKAVGGLLRDNREYVEDLLGKTIKAIPDTDIVDIAALKDSNMTVVDFLQSNLKYFISLDKLSEEQKGLQKKILGITDGLERWGLGELTLSQLFSEEYLLPSLATLPPIPKIITSDSLDRLQNELGKYTEVGREYLLDLIINWDKSIWSSGEEMQQALDAIYKDVATRMPTYSQEGKTRHVYLMSQINKSIFTDYLSKVYSSSNFTAERTMLDDVLASSMDFLKGVGEDVTGFDDTVSALFKVIRESTDKDVSAEAAKNLTRLVDAATIQMRKVLAPEDYLKFLKQRELLFADLLSYTEDYSEGKKLFATSLASLKIYSTEFVNGKRVIDDLTKDEKEYLLNLYDAYEEANKAYIEALQQGQAEEIEAAFNRAAQAKQKLSQGIVKSLDLSVEVYAKRVLFELGSKAVESFIRAIGYYDLHIGNLKVFDSKTKKLFSALPSMTIDVKSSLEKGLDLVLRSRFDQIQEVVEGMDIKEAVGSVFADILDISTEEDMGVFEGFYNAVLSKVEAGSSIVDALLSSTQQIIIQLDEDTKQTLTSIGQAYDTIMESLDDPELKSLANSYFGEDFIRIVEAVSLYGTDAANKFTENLKNMLEKIKSTEEEIYNIIDNFDPWSMPKIDFEGYSLDTILNYASEQQGFAQKVVEAMKNDYMLLQSITTDFGKSIDLESFTADIEGQIKEGTLKGKDILETFMNKFKTQFPEIFNMLDVSGITSAWEDKFNSWRDTIPDNSEIVAKDILSLITTFIELIFTNVLSEGASKISNFRALIGRASPALKTSLKAAYTKEQVVRQQEAIPTISPITKARAMGLPTSATEAKMWFKEAIKDVPQAYLQESMSYFSYVENTLLDTLIKAIKVLSNPQSTPEQVAEAQTNFTLASQQLKLFKSYTSSLEKTSTVITNATKEVAVTFSDLADLFKNAIKLLGKNIDVFSERTLGRINIKSYGTYIEELKKNVDELNSFFDYLVSSLLYGLSKSNSVIGNVFEGSAKSILTVTTESIKNLSKDSYTSIYNLVVNLLKDTETLKKQLERNLGSADGVSEALDEAGIFLDQLLSPEKYVTQYSKLASLKGQKFDVSLNKMLDIYFAKLPEEAFPFSGRYSAKPHYALEAIRNYSKIDPLRNEITKLHGGYLPEYLTYDYEQGTETLKKNFANFYKDFINDVLTLAKEGNAQAQTVLENMIGDMVYPYVNRFDELGQNIGIDERIAESKSDAELFSMWANYSSGKYIQSLIDGTNNALVGAIKFLFNLGGEELVNYLEDYINNKIKVVESDNSAFQSAVDSILDSADIFKTAKTSVFLEYISSFVGKAQAVSDVMQIYYKALGSNVNHLSLTFDALTNNIDIFSEEGVLQFRNLFKDASSGEKDLNSLKTEFVSTNADFIKAYFGIYDVFKDGLVTVDEATTVFDIMRQKIIKSGAVDLADYVDKVTKNIEASQFGTNEGFDIFSASIGDVIKHFTGIGRNIVSLVPKLLSDILEVATDPNVLQAGFIDLFASSMMYIMDTIFKTLIGKEVKTSLLDYLKGLNIIKETSVKEINVPDYPIQGAELNIEDGVNSFAIAYSKMLFEYTTKAREGLNKNAEQYVTSSEEVARNMANEIAIPEIDTEKVSFEAYRDALVLSYTNVFEELYKYSDELANQFNDTFAEGLSLFEDTKIGNIYKKIMGNNNFGGIFNSLFGGLINTLKQGFTRLLTDAFYRTIRDSVASEAKKIYTGDLGDFVEKALKQEDFIKIFSALQVDLIGFVFTMVSKGIQVLINGTMEGFSFDDLSSVFARTYAIINDLINKQNAQSAEDLKNTLDNLSITKKINDLAVSAAEYANASQVDVTGAEEVKAQAIDTKKLVQEIYKGIDELAVSIVGKKGLLSNILGLAIKAVAKYAPTFFTKAVEYLRNIWNNIINKSKENAFIEGNIYDSKLDNMYAFASKEGVLSIIQAANEANKKINLFSADFMEKISQQNKSYMDEIDLFFYSDYYDGYFNFQDLKKALKDYDITISKSKETTSAFAQISAQAVKLDKEVQEKLSEKIIQATKDYQDILVYKEELEYIYDNMAAKKNGSAFDFIGSILESLDVSGVEPTILGTLRNLYEFKEHFTQTTQDAYTPIKKYFDIQGSGSALQNKDVVARLKAIRDTLGISEEELDELYASVTEMQKVTDDQLFAFIDDSISDNIDFFKKIKEGFNKALANAGDLRSLKTGSESNKYYSAKLAVVLFDNYKDLVSFVYDAYAQYGNEIIDSVKGSKGFFEYFKVQQLTPEDFMKTANYPDVLNYIKEEENAKILSGISSKVIALKQADTLKSQVKDILASGGNMLLGSYETLVSAFTKDTGLAVEGHEKEFYNYVVGKMEELYTQVASSLGSSLHNLASVIKDSFETLNLDQQTAEFIANIADAFGTIVESSEQIRLGVEQGMGFAATYKKAREENNATTAFTSLIGMFSSTLNVVVALITLAAAIISLFKESNKLTETQIDMLKRNTTALETLTDVMKEVSAKVYNQPQAFAYGYATTSTFIAPEFAPGFKVGGFTGQGAPDEIAGVVHKGEYVVPSWLVKKFPDTIMMLEQHRTKGYQSGGLVDTNISKLVDYVSYEPKYGVYKSTQPVINNITNNSNVNITVNITGNVENSDDIVSQVEQGIRKAIKSMR